MVPTTIDKLRINNQIKAPELRVIGTQGENLGVMPLQEALALAKPTEGIDLIEITPHAMPPIARLMSYDKYRYERDKAIKKERTSQKTGGLKQIQIGARSAHNDLMIRIKKLEEFLAEGHPVEINMRLKGREKGNKDWAKQKLEEFLKMITIEYKLLTPPKFAGRGMTAQVVKK